MSEAGRYRIKHLVKLTLASVLYYCGLLHLYKAWKLNGRAVVLMYHRVLPQQALVRSGSHPGIIVERSAFERQMAFLKREFNVLSLPEFCRHVEHRIPFGAHDCLITFDDGWKDNFTHAAPVLRKHGFSAVIFLPVNYIGTARMFWQEELTAALVHIHRLARKDGSQKRRLRELLAGHGQEDILDMQEDDAREAIARIVQAKKTGSRDEVHALIRSLNACIGEPADTDRVDAFMDWQEVKVLSAAGISFGTHGMDHLILTRLASDEARREMADSRRVLEERIGAEVVAISYPNGDYSPEIASAAGAEGYRVAFTTKGGYADLSGDPLAINRINVHTSAAEESDPLFLSMILGIL